MSLNGVRGASQVQGTGNVGATEGKFGKFKAALGEAKDKVANFFKGLPDKFSGTKSQSVSPGVQQIVDRHNEYVASDLDDTLGEMFGTRRPAGPDHKTDAEKVLGKRLGHI